MTWEKNYQYNVGLDFGILRNKITGTVEWFRKDAKDLLFQKQIPRYNGGRTYWTNEGHVMNTGFEFSVSGSPVRNKNFSWETTLNTTFIKNEIIDLAGNEQILVDNNSSFGGASQIHKPGYPIGSFYLYHWVGFDELGRNMFLTKDGNTVNTPAGDDSFIKGQGNPKWVWGWNNMLRWKNWSANFFFNASTGFQRLNMSRWTTAEFHGQYRFVTLADAYYKNWDNVADKKNAKYPTLKNGNFVTGKSDFWLEDASFLKFRNITIAYTLPQSLLKVASAQLSFNVQNILTITKYSGMDPEPFTAGQGVDRGSYPIPRTYTFGLKLDF